MASVALECIVTTKRAISSPSELPSVENHVLALHLAYFLLDAVNPKVGKHSYFLVGCTTFRAQILQNQGD